MQFLETPKQKTNILSDQIDIEKFEELIESIYQIFSSGKNLYSKKRTSLWDQLLNQIKLFIQSDIWKSINFLRCVSVGAIIFQLDTGNVLIYANISYIQNLFQKLPKSPSPSTISNKFGKLSTFKISDIPLLCQFREFIDKLSTRYPGCNIGWKLYEISNRLIDGGLTIVKYVPFNKYEYFDEKIIDSILDDNNETFSILISQLYHDNLDINQKFSMTKYKLPEILSDNPTYADLCAFFHAEQCLSILYRYLPDGLNSVEFMSKDNKGRLIMHFAAAGGSISIIEQLIKNGFDLDPEDNEGYTPSHYAAMFNSIETINFLWKNGADILHESSITSMTPFHIACLYGNIEIIKFIIEKVKVEQVISYFFVSSENNPLFLACKGGCDNALKYILNRILKVTDNLKLFKKNIFPSILFAFKSGSIKCVKTIINSEINYINDDSQNIIIEAVKYGHIDIVNFILKSIKIEQIHMRKALNIAVLNYNDSIIELLIQKGAAFELNPTEIGDLFITSFGNMSTVHLLDKYLNIPYKLKGKLFTEKAMQLNDEELFMFLLDKKCDVNSLILNDRSNKRFQIIFSTKRKINNQVKGNKKLNLYNPYFNDSFLNNHFYEILTENEKLQIEEIQKTFQQIERLTPKHYYSLLITLSQFCKENEFCHSTERCAVSGVIPSFCNLKKDDKFGTIIAINEYQISKILNKSSRTFSLNFLGRNATILRIDETETLLHKNRKIWNKINAYYQILSNIGYDFKYYFLFHQDFETEKLDLNFFDPEKVTLNKKALPNNHKYLQQYQEANMIDKKNKESQLHTKKLVNLINQIKSLIILISNYDSDESNSQLNQNSYEELDFQNFSDNDIIEYGMSILSELNNCISNLTINSSKNQDLNLEEIINIIYSNDTEKKNIARDIITDIVKHKKYNSWKNSKALEFGFLIKYCSSASYLRLYNFLNGKIPSISTIESSYREQIIEREKCLTKASEVTRLLDQYWNDIEDQVLEYVIEYNKTFSKEIKIDDFKINVCLGCDAASLTSFIEKVNKKNKSKNMKSSREKSEDKKQKKAVFQELVNGKPVKNVSSSSTDDINDTESHYFFTMLLQPFIWKLPCTVIHLTKSVDGHFSNKEAKEILEILKLINAHPHFKVKYFAADGETGLDEFHDLAFKKYEKCIDKVIKGEMSFTEFFDFVKEKVLFLPIIDMYHSEKSGRNRIINNDIKLGEQTDIINRINLEKNLELPGNVLNDLTSIGRMKDHYPIYLFQMKNALIEFEKTNNSAGFYIFVYSLILEVFRNTFIDIKNRLALSKLALFLLLLIYQKTYDLPYKTGLRKNAKSNNEFVWFNDRISIVKLINTLLAISTILNEPETYFYLGLERISSYPEEQFFGNYRTHLNNYYTPKNAFRYAVRSSLALDMQSDLKISFQVPKRANYGGAHLNFQESNSDKSHIYLGDLFSDENQIKIMANDIFQAGTGLKKKLLNKTEIFVRKISQFFENNPSEKIKKLSFTKGSGIFPRIKAHQNKT